MSLALVWSSTMAIVPAKVVCNKVSNNVLSHAERSALGKVDYAPVLASRTLDKDNTLLIRPL